jgi:hypothetical protein
MQRADVSTLEEVVSLGRADLSVRADDTATLRNHVAARREDVDEWREDGSVGLEDGSVFVASLSACRERLSARQANRSVFAEALSERVAGRLGIRGRPERARRELVRRARGTLLVPSGSLGAARVPVPLWTERLPMPRGRPGPPGRTSRRTESGSTKTDRISPIGERIDRHLGDVLSQHRAVRFEYGEVFLEGREALSPHREALHEDRAVIQPHRAVRAPFRDDRSAFVEDLSLFTAAVQRIRQGRSEQKSRLCRRRLPRLT